MTTTLIDIGDEIGKVSEAAGRAVVGFSGRWGRGSGFVVAPGRVLTNAHNLSDQELRVSFGDRADTATVLGVDYDTDLALLGVETEVSPVTWDAQDVSMSLGMPVLALANPGGRGLRATLGFVAGLQRGFRGPRGRMVEGGFEHTALAAPGSSGGPVFDMSGNLVGVNTRRLGRGFYLAQVADQRMKTTIDTLEVGGPEEPKRLGVGLAPSQVTKGLRRSMGLTHVDGLLVRFVEEESPAARAGIREGDVIRTADGNEISDVDHLLRALSSAGSSIELGLVRLNETSSLTVDLG
ncbi:MAG TPA: trypsin-like peptidase domain-containing protein [Acidimicrobiia bacterium]|nr:trypsin-like peptidase domain-containing protein [Acidimicrobiia bacterium]